MEGQDKTVFSSFKDLRLMSQTKKIQEDVNKRKSKRLCSIKRLPNENKIYETFTIKAKTKTKQDKELILKGLSSHFVFTILIQDSNIQEQLVSKFNFCQVLQGKYLMRQNDNASSFFILHQGRLKVQINGELKRKILPGEGFGELALLYSAPRSASIKAEKLSHLWYIDRATFKKAISTIIEATFTQNRAFIQNNKFFSCLTSQQKDKIASIGINQKYVAKKNICKQGDLASSMFILKSGELMRQQNNFQLGKIKKGDSFQQEAFLSKNCVRKQTVTAIQNSQLIAFGLQDVENVLGSNFSILILRNKARQVLMSSPYFKKLNSIYLQQIIDQLKVQKVANSQIVVKKGQKCRNNIIFVVDGTFEISDKRQQKQHKILFGQCSVQKEHRQSKYNFDVKFTSAGRIARLNYDQVQKKMGLTIEEAVQKGNQLGKIIEKQVIGKKQKINQTQNIKLSDLYVLKKLGEGQFGTVYLVSDKFIKNYYAIKCISKTETIKNKLENHILNEKDVLETVNTPFAVNYFRSYKDSVNIYFLMEFINGLQLFDVIRIIGLLNPQQTRFYAAILIHIMESLHATNILYRDLKPQNVMVQEDGYLKLIDMGTCKKIDKKAIIQKTFTLIGTPSYMAPQILSGKGYSYPADLWSLGVILFQFMAGYVPFGEDSDDPYQIYQQILKRQLTFPDIIKDQNAKSLIIQLLNKNPEYRLGSSYSALKNHPFFNTIDWNSLIDRQINSPFKVPKDKIINLSLLKELKPLSDFIKPNTKSFPIRKDLNPNWDQQF